MINSVSSLIKETDYNANTLGNETKYFTTPDLDNE